ncbi:hypothetical protein GQ42DRAFT_179946 [Ramicandelaber brevisporus]|nr:hypothetical protein GQ42DRAFT_179946 [Ramicandelaber brevisporus]
MKLPLLVRPVTNLTKQLLPAQRFNSVRAASTRAPRSAPFNRARSSEQGFSAKRTSNSGRSDKRDNSSNKARESSTNDAAGHDGDKPRVRYKGPLNPYILAQKVTKHSNTKPTAVIEAADMVKSSPISAQSTPVWNHLLAECAQRGMLTRAIKLFSDMRKRGFKPNSQSLSHLLGACANSTSPVARRTALRLYKMFGGNPPDVLMHGKNLLYNDGASLPNRLKQKLESAKSEDEKEAAYDLMDDEYLDVENFAEMRSWPVSVSILHFNALLKVFVSHGDLDRAMAAFHTMPRSGPMAPDAATYTMLMQAHLRSSTAPPAQESRNRAEQYMTPEQKDQKARLKAITAIWSAMVTDAENRRSQHLEGQLSTTPPLILDAHAIGAILQAYRNLGWKPAIKRQGVAIAEKMYGITQEVPENGTPEQLQERGCGHPCLAVDESAMATLRQLTNPMANSVSPLDGVRYEEDGEIKRRPVELGKNRFAVTYGLPFNHRSMDLILTLCEATGDTRKGIRFWRLAPKLFPSYTPTLSNIAVYTATLVKRHTDLVRQAHKSSQ